MGFTSHSSTGDLFVDIGANVGSYSILAGACENVNVIAVEPVPTTFHGYKNINLNKFEKCVKN